MEPIDALQATVVACPKGHGAEHLSYLWRLVYCVACLIGKALAFGFSREAVKGNPALSGVRPIHDSISLSKNCDRLRLMPEV